MVIKCGFRSLMMKFLHLSDIHINAPFASRDEKIRNNLKNSLWESFERAINFALSEQLEAVIFAGDFFDHHRISFLEENQVAQNFNQLLNAGIKIIVVSGNHDPMDTIKLINRFKKHPNFILFEGDEIGIRKLKSRNGENYTVVGVGHKSKNEQRNLISEFPLKSDDQIWIGVAHASVPTASSTPEKGHYMATPLRVIEQLNYDYFALGHIHIRQKLTNRIAYSGNIQGLSIKETDARGGFIVDIFEGHTQLTPINFSGIDFHVITVNIDETVDQLPLFQELLRDEVSEGIGKNDKPANRLIYRIELTGRSPLKHALQNEENLSFIGEWIKEQTGLLAVEIVNSGVKNLENPEKFINENTVLAEVLKSIQQIENDVILKDRLNALKMIQDPVSLAIKIKDALMDEAVERMVKSKDEN